MKALTKSTKLADAFNLAPRASLYWAVVPALISLSALIFFWHLGEGSLSDWDEAIYAQVSKEMVQSGDWLTPHYGFQPLHHKPPLLMWCTAVLYKLWGINEFTARAASALSGVALIIVVYLTGKLVYGAQTGLIAAVILLTSAQFVYSARIGTTDIMLTLWIWLALCAYLQVSRDGPKWWLLVGASCGLALMTKSAAAAIAPVAILLALLCERRLSATWREKYFWYGCGLGLLIAAPWHILMVLTYGRKFTEVYFGQQLFARTTGALEGNTGGRLFYLDILRQYFVPWFYLLPFALLLSLKENLRRQFRSRIFLIVALLVFALYTLVQTKLDWYIIPLYPALAILIASLIEQAFDSPRSIAFGALLLTTAATALLLVPLKVALLFGGGIFCALFFFALRARRFAHRPIAAALCAFLLVAGATQLQEPAPEQQEDSLAQLAVLARSSDGARDREPLIIYDNYYLTEQFAPTPLFYSNRPILIARTSADIANFTADHQAKRIILAKEFLGSLVSYKVTTVAEAGAFIYATIKAES